MRQELNSFSEKDELLQFENSHSNNAIDNNDIPTFEEADGPSAQREEEDSMLFQQREKRLVWDGE